MAAKELLLPAATIMALLFSWQPGKLAAETISLAISAPAEAVSSVDLAEAVTRPADVDEALPLTVPGGQCGGCWQIIRDPENDCDFGPIWCHAVPGGEIWEVPEGAQGGWYVNKDPDGFHTEFEMGTCTNTSLHDTCSGGFALSVEVLRAYVRAEKTAAVARAVANSNGFFRHNVQDNLIEILRCDGSSIAERIALPVTTRFSELSS